jgi:hypothetical protein
MPRDSDCFNQHGFAGRPGLKPEKAEIPSFSASKPPISFLCNSSLADADKRC